MASKSPTKPKTSSVADRIRMVQEQSVDPKTGRPRLSGHKWSVTAGLAKGLVNSILAGKIKGGSSPDTFDRLARVADVSPHWLATGLGDMRPYKREAEVDIPERAAVRYPNLETTIEYMIRKEPNRWSEATISGIRTMLNKQQGPKADPTVAEWEERLDALEEYVRGKLPGTEIETSLTPPRGRKK